VCWFLIWVLPFLVWMVIFGSNPMNEYWASFSGPSMDSKR
jgi:ABC-type polysaccharide transport system permease subunit